MPNKELQVKVLGNPLWYVEWFVNNPYAASKEIIGVFGEDEKGFSPK